MADDTRVTTAYRYTTEIRETRKVIVKQSEIDYDNEMKQKYIDAVENIIVYFIILIVHLSKKKIAVQMSQSVQFHIHFV